MHNLSLTSLIPTFYIAHFLPVVPYPQFYSSVGSTFMAGAAGGCYGLIGRVIYPHVGIDPLHYAVWFVLAFQIKKFVFAIEEKFETFLLESYLHELEDIQEDRLGFHDLVRFHCWKWIYIKNDHLKSIDEFFCKIFGIRPYVEIDKGSIEEASFLEMSRYRIWPIFKLTVLDTLSFAMAHRLSNEMGFIIPSGTAVPLFIIIRSIAKDILLVPALYVYVRVCNKIADSLDEDERAAAYRAEWIRRWLPPLSLN